MPTLADLVKKVRIVHEVPGAAEAAQKIRDVAAAQRDVQKASVDYQSVGNVLHVNFQNLKTAAAGYLEQVSPSALGQAAAGIAAVGVAYVAAAAGAAYLAKNAADAVAAYSKFEDQQTTIQNVMQATGTASGKTADQVERLAQTFQNVDDARQAAQALLQFTTVSGDVYDRALKAAANLSASGFGGLTQAAQAVGRALQDPVNGLKGLGAVADTFTFQQQKAIQALYETGHAAEAQRAILDALEQKLGGAATAQAGTLSGAWANVAKQTQLGQEQFGQAIVQITHLTTAVQALASGLEYVNSIDPATILKIAAGLATIPIPFLSGFGARNLVSAYRGGGAKQPTAESFGLSGPENAAARIADERAAQKAIDAVTDSINKRIEAGRRSEVQNAIEAELVKAKTTIDTQAGQQIAAQVTQLYAEADARKAAAEAARKAAAEAERAADLRVRRQLQGEQELDQARLEIELINATAGAAAAARADLASYYQLKQDAARTHTPFDQAELDRLRAYHAELGKLINQREQLSQISQAIEGPLVSGLTDIVSGSKKAGVAFQDMAQTVIRSLEQMIIKLLIVQPLMNAISGFIGGGPNLATAGVGATGPALGKFVVGHSGGIVGNLTETRYLHPAYFENAPRFAAGLNAHAPGINEVAVLAHKGELIGWPDQMRRAFGGRDGDVNVKVVVENHGADVDVTDKKRNADGSVDIRMAVRSVMQEDIARGQYDGAMSGRYGARVPTRRV